ncbi:M23 family peptidase [Sphingomonas gilva]|uniref:M23 family peptidase n=1 Tax=Sphingomonas gilva TaxID=2305907 RepID=A0A396RMS6_9SPHN|nr:M23 family metallopeptidase [Sphingomonas gilva]RHW17734.1 M23 family peptidase [Sphingomonas gilva]
MFQRHEHGFGQAGGAAALSLDQIYVPHRQPDTALERLRRTLADTDWTPDLGARIGSREWWRGLVTLTALCGATIALAPEIGEPLAGPTLPQLTASEFDEARAQSFAPLAWGGDTGRRMGATDAVVPLAGTPERPSIELTATLGQGDGFARVLERAGVAKGEARQVADLVSAAVALGDIAPGTRIDITLGRRARRSDPRPLDHLAFRARFDLNLAVERVGGSLQLKRLPIAVDRTPLRIQGRVGASLYRAARAAGAPAKAVEAYLRAMAQHVPVSRIGSDDRFDIIVEHARAETGEVQVGQLIYAGLDRGRKDVRLLRWEQDGRSQFFEASGVGETRGQMVRPVGNVRVSSSFGLRRHPVLGYSRMHKGMDFAAAYGTPIRAATDGTVSFAGRHGGHGKYVKLKHNGSIATGYAHMSRIAVKSGQRVRQGQVIGYVGSTGLSTGPHLHYELYKNGVAVNPKSVSFTTTAQLSGRELANFKSKLSNVLNTRVAGAEAPAEKVEIAAR